MIQIVFRWLRIGSGISILVKYTIVIVYFEMKIHELSEITFLKSYKTLVKPYIANKTLTVDINECFEYFMFT